MKDATVLTCDNCGKTIFTISDLGTRYAHENRLMQINKKYGNQIWNFCTKRCDKEFRRECKWETQQSKAN